LTERAERASRKDTGSERLPQKFSPRRPGYGSSAADDSWLSRARTISDVDHREKWESAALQHLSASKSSAFARERRLVIRDQCQRVVAAVRGIVCEHLEATLPAKFPVAGSRAALAMDSNIKSACAQYLDACGPRLTDAGV